MKTREIKIVFLSCTVTFEAYQKIYCYWKNFCTHLKKTPSIIAISETKLKENNLYNIALQDYIFLESNSKTSAGGVGFHVDKDVAFAQRTDLIRIKFGRPRFLLD